MFAIADIAIGDSSTELRADLVRSLDLTFAVERVFSSPKSWSLMVEKALPGKLSGRNTAHSLSLIFKSGSVAVACAS